MAATVAVRSLLVVLDRVESECDAALFSTNAFHRIISSATTRAFVTGRWSVRRNSVDYCAFAPCVNAFSGHSQIYYRKLRNQYVQLLSDSAPHMSG